MANKNTKRDYEIMKEYAISSAVDSKILDQGAYQLDKVAANIQNIDSYVTDQISLKRELLQLIKKSRTEGMTNALRKRIVEIQTLLHNTSVPKQINQKNILTQDVDMSYSQMVESNRKFAIEYGIDLKNPYMEALSNVDKNLLTNELAEKFDLLRLDKYDYAFATAVGLLCGAIDAILIGTASNNKSDMGILAQKTDDFFDKIVIKYAELNGWKGPNLNSNGDYSNQLKSAIGYLENKFPVGYDQRYPKDIDYKFGGMSPSNHHLLSLSHSPLGLIFAILDFHDNKASFLDPKTGKIIRTSAKWSKKAIENQQNNVSGIAQSTARWFGHAVSDIAGSSGGTTRGAGLPTGVESILMRFNFGKIPINNDEYMTISQSVVKMYENGFDLRFKVSTAIPVIVNEIIVRLYWMLKQHFYYGKPFNKSLPFGKDRELQRLLLISTLSFSSVDVTHAIVKGIITQNPISTLNSLNYIGLADLGYKLIYNFKLEHEHNQQIRKIMEQEIKQKHQELMQNDFLLN